MIDFFHKTIEVIVPKYDSEGEEIDKRIIYDAVQTLMSNTTRCSITETHNYYNSTEAIIYKFRYTPEIERRENNVIVHSIYTIISTLLLYNELEFSHCIINDNNMMYTVKDLDNLKFKLDRLLFDK